MHAREKTVQPTDTPKLLRTVLGVVYKPPDGRTAGVPVLNHCNGRPVQTFSSNLPVQTFSSNLPVQTFSSNLRMPAKFRR